MELRELLEELKAIPEWARYLPAKSREVFAREVLGLLASWRSTALVHADPRLKKELTRPLAGPTRRLRRPSVSSSLFAQGRLLVEPRVGGLDRVPVSSSLFAQGRLLAVDVGHGQRAPIRLKLTFRAGPATASALVATRVS